MSLDPKDSLYYHSTTPLKSMLNVFISSTTRDLKRYRDKRTDRVRNFQLSDIAMERWGASPEPPPAVVRDALEQSDVFVGIFAWRYGSTVDGRNVSYIEYEHELACELGKMAHFPCGRGR